MAEGQKSAAGKDVVGAKELVALLCVTSIGVGLWQLHHSLPWIWVGVAGLFLLWQSYQRRK